MTRDPNEPQFIAARDLPWVEPTPIVTYPLLIVPAGRHVLHARHGSCKSWLALRSCVELERGGERSVVVASEGRPALGHRITMVGAGADPSREFGRDIYIVKPESRWRLRDLHDQIIDLDPRLAVIDTMIGFADGVDENSADQVQAFFEENIEPLCRAGMAVLLLHHNNKAAGIRGSTAIGGWADAIYALERDEPAGLLDVTCTKMRDLEQPPPYRLKWSLVDGVARIDPVVSMGGAPGTRVRVRSSKLEAAVLEHIREAPSPPTQTEICAGLKKAGGVISPALENLLSDRCVVRVQVDRHDARGRPRTDWVYVIPTPGHPDGRPDTADHDDRTTGHTPLGVSGCPSVEPRALSTAAVLDEALLLHRLGHLVIPVLRNKRPHPAAGKWSRLYEMPWTQDELVRAFSAPGVSGIALLTGWTCDVADVEHHGLETVAGLEQPLTPASRTQGNGGHTFYKTGFLRATKLVVAGKTIGDVKARRNGYVCVPPSVGEKGCYRWEPGRSIHELALAEPPAWLRDVAGIDTAKSRKGHSRPRRAAPRQGEAGATAGSVGSASVNIDAALTGTTGTTSTVTPPKEKAFATGSEEEMSNAHRLLGEGKSQDEVVAIIAESTTAHRRGENRIAWAERTVTKANARRRDNEQDARALAVPARVVAVKPDPRAPASRQLISLDVELAAGDHKLVRYPLDWPITERSRRRWTSLRDACAVPDDAHPRDVVGRELRVELRAEGAGHTVGRVFAGHAEGGE